MDSKATQVQAAAAAVVNYVQIAVGEMGYSEYIQDEWSAEISRAKSRGVTDVGGWLADELYNDVGTVQDLAGDRMYNSMRQFGLDVKNKDDWDAVAAKVKSMLSHVGSKIDLSYIA